ncbi:ribbon-helix-helix protein, CopG family [Halovulum sp. GXIMD14794]
MAPPKKNTQALTVRVSQQMLAALDDRRREEQDLPTRPEMVRRLLADVLGVREDD